MFYKLTLIILELELIIWILIVSNIKLIYYHYNGEKEKMRTAIKGFIITRRIVILASFIFVYLISLSYVSSEEIDKQVENLQTKYRQDFSEEIREHPAHRVIGEVLGEPNVKEMYRDYLEALNYGNKEDADRTYDRFKNAMLKQEQKLTSDKNIL